MITAAKLAKMTKEAGKLELNRFVKQMKRSASIGATSLTVPIRDRKIRVYMYDHLLQAGFEAIEKIDTPYVGVSWDRAMSKKNFIIPASKNSKLRAGLLSVIFLLAIICLFIFK